MPPPTPASTVGFARPNTARISPNAAQPVGTFSDMPPLAAATRGVGLGGGGVFDESPPPPPATRPTTPATTTPPAIAAGKIQPRGLRSHWTRGLSEAFVDGS